MWTNIELKVTVKGHLGSTAGAELDHEQITVMVVVITSGLFLLQSGRDYNRPERDWRVNKEMFPLLRVFPPYSGQNSVMSCDILASSHVGELGVNKIKCKKDILVAGDHEDVSDIVEKFIKVAHGPTALENNRARENARENIRKKLALEAGREKMDGCDLQVRTENIRVSQSVSSLT